MGQLKVKRVYEAAGPDDGARILVDRLWPRGISKEKAQLTDWCKSVAPSTELRKWFGHDAAKFTEFNDRYVAELNANPDADAFRERVLGLLDDGDVTLLFGAKDVEHNNAVVVKEWLSEKMAG